MPPGYDALRDVLQTANSPTQTKPDIKNLLNSDPPPPSMHLPYNPTHRLTPPTSVLIPLTLSEFQSFKIPRHALRIRAKRLDPALENPNFFPPSHQDTSSPGKRKRTSPDAPDPTLVAEHYNSRREVGIDQRRESPIIGLKTFNNWIKTVLFAKFATQPLQHSPIHVAQMKGKVLDIGCGKGGDLIKWKRLRIREYVGLDIAAVSVDQARVRHQQLKGQKFDATFASLDCYTNPLTAALSPETLARPFDVVSMQFCMHYAFETVAKVRMMLENVSKYLRNGGVFLGTIPNAELLMERLNALPKDASPKFGNSVYQIRFEDRQPRPQLFGHRYWFFLQDAVEDVPEYVVQWDNFEQLALEHGLHLLYKEEFHDMFAAEREHPEYKPLMHRMKVVSASGESEMDEDQWEAANIYLAFAFEKR